MVEAPPIGVLKTGAPSQNQFRTFRFGTFLSNPAATMELARQLRPAAGRPGMICLKQRGAVADLVDTEAMTNQGDLLPDPPKFSEKEMRRCKETGDYAPVLFEWYKFVASLVFHVGHIRLDSPAFRRIRPQQYHVLIGLLNRCARLMLSNVALSHEGKFGETTAIVDRCIFESAMKAVWLCEDSSQEKFDRYLAEGLKSDLEFKAEIESSIAARNGKTQPVERRMLSSIANCIKDSELSEPQILATKKLPDMAAMMNSIGFDRLQYVIGQRIGSHHVHGTWPSLLFHYLKRRGGEGAEAGFIPRGHNCATHINQYMYVSLVVMKALTAYVRFAFERSEDSQVFIDLFETTADDIMEVYTTAIVDDLE